MGRVYLYVDGESHYTRTKARAQELLGTTALGSLRGVSPLTEVSAIEACGFFWDMGVFNIRLIGRAVYFTSFTGTDPEIHEYSAAIRKVGFEPYIVKEDKQHRRGREKLSEQCQLIEKPKGVDIALTIRLLEDAVNNNYDACVLFTSDADYLPVIKAVRRMGKVVSVYGYTNAIGNKELEYAPDEFTDLAYRFKKDTYRVLAEGTGDHM